MKIIYLVILIQVSAPVMAQQDTTLNLVAKWRKGEQRELVITRSKEKVESGNYNPPFNLTYLAHVSILDSNSEGYKIQWVLDLTEDFKKENPGIETVLPVYNGFKIIFTTDPVGVFRNLLNWEEVRDGYLEMTDASTSKKMDSAAKVAMDKAKAMFNSQQMVEAAFIKEVQLYYSLYGAEFTTKGIQSPTLLPNPFGGDPMPAVIEQKITRISTSQNSFTGIFTQKLDSSGTRILINSVFKAMDLPADQMDSIMKYSKDMFSRFRVEDNGEYEIVTSTGWITALKYERIGMTGEMKQTETFMIRMK